MGSVTSSPMTKSRLIKLGESAARLGSTLSDSRVTLEEVHDELRQLAIDISSIAPDSGPNAWDLYLYGALQRAATTALLALGDEESPVSKRDARVAVEQIRQAVRDQLEAVSILDSLPANDIAQWVVEALDVSQAEVAALIGTNLRTLQRWITTGTPTSPRGEEEHRLRIVAGCVRHLRHTLTGRGVLSWFARPKPELGGRTPTQILDEPDLGPVLITLASRDRSHNAT